MPIEHENKNTFMLGFGKYPHKKSDKRLYM